MNNNSKCPDRALRKRTKSPDRALHQIEQVLDKEVRLRSLSSLAHRRTTTPPPSPPIAAVPVAADAPYVQSSYDQSWDAPSNHMMPERLFETRRDRMTQRIEFITPPTHRRHPPPTHAAPLSKTRIF